MSLNYETQYAQAISDLLELSKFPEEYRMDRTGTGIWSKFGERFVLDVQQQWHLPMLLGKRVWLAGVARELEWFISGSQNVYDLHPSLHHWWLPFADEAGDLGPIYGPQLRGSHIPDGTGVDPLMELVKGLAQYPFSRRHVISLWNNQDIPHCRLPPCHGTVIQLFVRRSGKYDTILDMACYQRSADLLLGVPINIASYTLLLNLIVNELNLDTDFWKTGRLIYNFGDMHLYSNQIDAAEEYLSNLDSLPDDSDNMIPIKGLTSALLFDFNAESLSIDPNNYKPIVLKNKPEMAV